MPEKGWEDLPEHDVGEAPNRFDVDGFRARLFGGPGATLYGDSGIPAQSNWDSKEIPTVGRDGISDSGVRHSGVHHSGSWGAEEFLGGDDRRGGEPAPHETGSLVRTTSDRGKAPDAAVLPEHRSICGLCLDTRSVAEVAAHLRLPLGVARVLIGDMAGMGLVLIHQSGMVVGDRPSIDFMERVLSGLRRL